MSSKLNSCWTTGHPNGVDVPARSMITSSSGWGYGAEHNTWEPEGNLSNCQELIQQYWESKAAIAAVRARAKGIKRVRQGLPALEAK